MSAIGVTRSDTCALGTVAGAVYVIAVPLAELFAERVPQPDEHTASF
jgi:hypothetical protein